MALLDQFLDTMLDKADPTAPEGTPNNPSSRVLTVANGITLARIALTIVFFFLFINHVNRIACFVLFGVAAATDWLDGQIARRTQTVTWVGKLMDPAVDRLLIFSGVVGLCVVGDLPVWIPIVIVGRDIWLGALMLVIRNIRKRPLDVLYIGKVATALLLFGFCLMLLGWPMLPAFGWVDVSWLPLFNHQPATLGILFVYAGVVCSVITGILYTLEMRRVLVRARMASREGEGR